MALPRFEGTLLLVLAADKCKLERGPLQSEESVNSTDNPVPLEGPHIEYQPVYSIS